MIYQCFYDDSHKLNLFNSDCYQPFGLEPNLNENLLDNCPELKIKANRKALNEYSCFLWFYRNQHELGSHFGTTSFRQLDKSKSIFTDISSLKELCSDNNILTWGLNKNVDSSGFPIPVSLATEVRHPFMNSYIFFLFNEFNYDIPDQWFMNSECIYANYWYLSKELFIDFMNYSWPMIEFSLKFSAQSHHNYFSYKNTNPNANVKSRRIGYLAERLFILWYFSSFIDIINLGDLRVFQTGKFYQ